MAGPEQSESLAAALDELYAVDPSEFVAVRKRLAGELKGAGEKDAAKAVLAARRPTTAAWALNQVSRQEPALVEALLDASRELHAAQIGSEGRDVMREATREHRDALAALTEAGLAMLESRANDTYRSQIQATLHAASVDDEVGDELRLGRIAREATGSSGFPDVPGLTLVPDLPAPAAEPSGAPARKKPPPKQQPREASQPSAAQVAAAEKAQRAEQERVEREQAAAAERERQRIEAEAAWQVAQDEAAEAESAAAAAHERVAGLEQDLDEARRQVKAADDRAASARREAARLARAAMKLQP